MIIFRSLLIVTIWWI